VMQRNSVLNILAVLAALAAPLAVQGQTAVTEDFSGSSTTNSWWFFNGACLTASRATGVEPATGAGQIPGCTTIQHSYYNETLVGGYNGTFPDPVNATNPLTGSGALRFTNGFPGGYHQNGAIVSTTPFPTTQGITVTFKTVTYLGDSGGAGSDGADGISFYLLDASQLNTSTITGTAAGDGNGLGSWGGSLGYTCSNANPPYNGLIGGYVAVGIDEYGNFLNGSNWVSGYNGPNNATGDNTAFGYGYKPDRIGMRGAGNIAWSWLNANYPSVYPSSYSNSQRQGAVQATCQNGVIWDYSKNHAVDASDNNVNSSHQVPLYDYAPIPGAYVELPSTVQIANELALTRGAATPIFYQLKITPNGLLSLFYSVNGGAYQQVIKSQNITTANGPLPANFLFGFAGSTGGSTNIHEILCFQAGPSTSASGSAGASEKQSAKLETGVQAYFAFYNPSNGWTGRVTASSLGFDSYGNVVVATTPNWDAACNLTGVSSTSTCSTTGTAGPIAAQSATSRVVLSWNGTQGIPFEWSNLTSAQQTTLDTGDSSGSPALNSQSCPTSPSATAYQPYFRLNYLRGDRSCEVSTTGVGLFRRRSDVLADIIDSSPTWVGPPIGHYPAVWSDRLYPTATNPENASTAQTYQAFATGPALTRENVVYVGSNDGLMHGFRTGSYDANGNFVQPTNEPAPPAAQVWPPNNGNDGLEVMAYMPAAVMQTIHSTTNNVDYANVQYGHNFFVDATPGNGDVFYGGVWHTWLAGGLGPGGAAMFALDVTSPGAGGLAPLSNSFSEGSAASTVVGEWSNSTISCANVTNCGTNLGNTYGTPTLRRLHDGKWAMIFGNGFGSASGDAGIFVMTIDPTSGANTFYYYSTGTASTTNPNGIAFATPADMDGDHIIDYVYAGDLQGNVWRFDLTSQTESSWTVGKVGGTPAPVFKTGGQPITTAIVVAGGAPSAGMQNQVMLLFGTGQKIPVTNTTPATFATGTQSLYGVWDWNMAAWNAHGGTQYASLTSAGTGLSTTGYYMTSSNLQAQTVTVNTSTLDREIASNATPCWASQSTCSSNKQFGWYLNLPGTQEQVIYSPELVLQALTVNTVVPAPNNPTSCTSPNDTGFTYVINAMTGGAFNTVFLPPSEASNSSIASNPKYTDSIAIAMQTNATGTSFITTNAAGTRFLVSETNQVESGNGLSSNNIAAVTIGLNLPPNTTGRRLSWIERR
jgi:type IV pilus assembly protein PilY1